MRISPKAKLFGTAAILILLLAEIVGIRAIAWRRISEVQMLLSAAHLEAQIREFTETIVRYRSNPTVRDMTVLESINGELKGWLEHEQRTGQYVGNAGLIVRVRHFVTACDRILRVVSIPQGADNFVVLHGNLKSTASEALEFIEEIELRLRPELLSLFDEGHQKILWIKRYVIFTWFLAVVLGCFASVAFYQSLVVPMRTKLERQRLVAERQEKLASLGVLTAGFAHEVRNPLNSIKARLFTQRRELPEGSEAQEDNGFIAKEVDRLNDIIGRFLAFARPSDPHFKKIHVSEGLERLAELLRPGLERDSIRIEIDIQQDPLIEVDVNQMQQVLINIAKNAAEAIQSDGEIILRSRVIRDSGPLNLAASAVIEIQDNGPGISPEARDRLFDPFFTTKVEGTGLGLSISTRIIESHGGKLDCRSTPGKGTTFSIYLPSISDHGTSQDSVD